MAPKNHFNGKTMHIDTSRRFYQKGNTGIAYKVIPSNEHGGLYIKNKLKKELIESLGKNYAKFYAICIYYLIKDRLDLFDNLVICNDEKFSKVKNYLDLLFEKNKKYSSKFITSLSKLRKIAGDSKIRSYADNMANVYRRKAPKSYKRNQKGITLNIIEVNYKKIVQKWEEIDKK